MYSTSPLHSFAILSNPERGYNIYAICAKAFSFLGDCAHWFFPYRSQFASDVGSFSVCAMLGMDFRPSAC